MEYDKLKNWNQFLMNDNFTNVNIKIGDIYTTNKIYSYVEKIHKVEEDFYDGDIGERIAINGDMILQTERTDLTH